MIRTGCIMLHKSHIIKLHRWVQSRPFPTKELAVSAAQTGTARFIQGSADSSLVSSKHATSCKPRSPYRSALMAVLHSGCTFRLCIQCYMYMTILNRWGRLHLMAEVNTSDKLLEEPQGSGLRQAYLLVHCLMPVDIVCQVASCCILTHYCQVLGRQKDFPELDDVRVVKAQPLVEHLSGCYLYTAGHNSRGVTCLFTNWQQKGLVDRWVLQRSLPYLCRSGLCIKLLCKFQ